MIFARNATIAPDQAAQAIDSAMTPDELLSLVMAELNEVAYGKKKQDHKYDPNRELSKSEEQELMFSEANQEGDISILMRVGDQSAGTDFFLGGEQFTVISNDGTNVIIRDGEAYGEQSLDANDTIWVDDYFQYPQDVLDAMANELVDLAEDAGYDNIHGYAEENSEAVDKRSDQINPLFPALRSGHRLFQRPSHKKQIPSSKHFQNDITINIVSKADTLTLFPYIGTSSQINPESRVFIVKNWAVYYTIREKYILIQTILSHQQGK